MEAQKETLESWDSFTGTNWLKASDVKDSNDTFAIIRIELEEKENPRPLLILERNKIEYHFSLNVTNANKCREFKINTPKDLVGKTITFHKVLVRDPNRKQEVEGLRIHNLIS
jgi:hypothetical protein